MRFDMKYFRFPEKLVDKSLRNYSVVVENENFDFPTDYMKEENIPNSINISGYNLVERDADFIITLKFKYIEINSFDVGPVPVKYVNVNCSMGFSYTVVDKNGTVLHDKVLYDLEKAFDINVLKNGICKYSEAQLNAKGYVQNDVDNNREYYSKFISRNVFNSVIRGVNADLDTRFVTRSFMTEQFLGYVKKKKKINITDVWKSNTKAAVAILAKMNVGASAEQTRADLTPYIDFWEAEMKRCNIDDKKERRIVGMAAFNLITTYLWLYEFDKAQRVFEFSKGISFKYDRYLLDMVKTKSLLKKEHKFIKRQSQEKAFLCKSVFNLDNSRSFGKLKLKGGQEERVIVGVLNRPSRIHTGVHTSTINDYLAANGKNMFSSYDPKDVDYLFVRNRKYIPRKVINKAALSLPKSYLLELVTDGKIKLMRLSMFDEKALGFVNKCVLQKEEGSTFIVLSYRNLLKLVKDCQVVHDKLKNGDYGNPTISGKGLSGLMSRLNQDIDQNVLNSAVSEYNSIMGAQSQLK